MTGYRTGCPWCGREVSVVEHDEHDEHVEDHRPADEEGVLGGPPELCGGSGEVFIDVREEARAEARLGDPEEEAGRWAG